MKKSAQVQKSGFTLVELLVVIAIIAILAAVVVLIINPLELTRRGRDAARLSDLANLQNAINVAVQEATGSGTETILCAQGFNNTASSCKGVSNTGGRGSDGTGWVAVNLSAQQSVSVPTLPADPTNDANSHYTYCSDGDSWEINAALESTQQSGKEGSDGGDDPASYEVGSNLKLISVSGSAGAGPCTY